MKKLTFVLAFAVSASIVVYTFAGSASAAPAFESSQDAGHRASGHDGGHVATGHDGGHVSSGHDGGH